MSESKSKSWLVAGEASKQMSYYIEEISSLHLLCQRAVDRPEDLRFFLEQMSAAIEFLKKIYRHQEQYRVDETEGV